MDGKIQTFKKCLMIPTECFVTCPCCLKDHKVIFSEQHDGTFEPDMGEQFINCECGELIEIIGFHAVPTYLQPIPATAGQHDSKETLLQKIEGDAS